MRTDEFDYRLPPERIAQEPLAERDASRLLVLDRTTGATAHRLFRDLPELLAPGDLVVLNDTRVVPARLFGRRAETGGRVEALFLKQLEGPGGARYMALTRSGGKIRPGETLVLGEGRVRAVLVERRGLEGDVLEVGVDRGESLEKVLEEIGHMPVPPYIKRDPDSPPSRLDRRRYQTEYARRPGAVAAPTAGLHFTKRVFARLTSRGCEVAFLTLHVGPGTFRPVKAETIGEHYMSPEVYDIPPETAEVIERTASAGGRVVAVGTTVVRALESAAEGGRVRPGKGSADVFIKPPFDFKTTTALVTNFHLPRGTPLVLVCAFAGRASASAGKEKVLAAYDEALRSGYRFLSYGDAMLVL